MWKHWPQYLPNAYRASLSANAREEVPSFAFSTDGTVHVLTHDAEDLNILRVGFAGLPDRYRFERNVAATVACVVFLLPD
jgi:hypothetical protein